MNKSRVIYTLMLTFMLASNVCADSFSDFFIQFFYDTDTQADKVVYPIYTPSSQTRVKSGWQTIYLKNKNRLAILCSDAEDAITNYPSISPAIIDIKSHSGKAYTFQQDNSSWKLNNVSAFQSTSFADNDFMSFLERFSGDSDFQKKRIIFPLKEITYKKSEPTSSKLYMPQNWQHLDYFAMLQQICWFRTGEDNSANRQIILYENGVKSIAYNFIRIRNNWFLIEINLYK